VNCIYTTKKQNLLEKKLFIILHAFVNACDILSITKGSVVKMNASKIKKSVNNLGVIITIFLFLIASITLIINFTLNNVFIDKYFSKIENEGVISKTEQSRKIFQSKIKEIETLVEDNAIWDENYNKVQEKNIDETWFKENFTEWLPDIFGMNLVVIVNNRKKIIVQYGVNNNNDILNDNTLLQLLNKKKYSKETRVSGFKKYGENLYMIAALPIFKSNGEGDCQGILILGKQVSSTLVQKIKEESGSDVFITYDNKFISSEDTGKEVDENIAVINKNINNKVHKVNNSRIIGRLPITDIRDNNIGYINVIQHRDVFLSTQKLTKRNVVFAMFLSSIVILILGLKFKNIIVNPIKSLENQIKNMEHENLLMHTSVNANGPNEIINLSESFNHMIDSINQHKKENQELKIYANTDYLTSVYNHKYYYESINDKIVEGHKQISIMFCDIDKFKLINDAYGHKIGDFLLREIANIIKDKVKDAGMVFRYGGEEFVIIMCDYASEEALIQAEEIRKSIAKSQKLQKYADYFPITISIGIASYPNHALEGEGLIKKSDTAMYYSKQSGRNQCNIYNNNMDVFSKYSNKDINKELLMDSVLALAEAVDAKDEYTGEHSKMVSKYSILLAEKLGFTESEKNKLRIGSLLHDCGKIGIPDNIINKPEKLSDEEFAIIKNHTLLGNNIIKHITNDQEIVNSVRSHHERWDGRGYPDGISGNSIHLFARIVCIADVYHAMTSDRPYREALTKEKAIDEFKRGKGTQFDPMLVDVFVEIIEDSMQI
jgi:diguanylate cyclase (GGDEF)-like protein/putative nucleotidyltransferase with HDIG domain